MRAGLPGAGAVAVALALLVASGCGDTPAAQQARPGVLWMVPEVGLALSQSAVSSIEALDPPTGAILWRLPRHLPPDPPFGGRRFPPPLTCPPRLTRDGKMILRFAEGVYAVQPRLGQLLWMQRLAPPALCAAPTEDSGVVAVSRRRKELTKFDGAGNVAWRAQLPLDGAAVTGPEVVPGSGDVLVRMARHVVCFDPGGSRKWTRALDEAAPGSPAPDVVDEHR